MVMGYEVRLMLKTGKEGLAIFLGKTHLGMCAGMEKKNGRVDSDDEKQPDNDRKEEEKQDFLKEFIQYLEKN